MKSKKILIETVIFGVILISAPLYAADITVNVYASSYTRSIPETMYGTNTHTWDGKQNGGDDNYNGLMAASDRRYLRWPGGSWGDYKLWSKMEWNLSQTWIVSYDESMYMINKMGGIMQPIVNFHGNWEDANHFDEAITAAAAWVQDQTSRIPTARYWEIGNEVYGDWEAGYDANINGTYYGDRYADFYLAMKQMNPHIKIGAVGREYDNQYNQWTRNLLLAANAKGVVPDFITIHMYPGSWPFQPPSYNPTMLGFHIDEIANFTTSLNNIVSAAIGSSYVGKIKYWMTEWNTDGSYPRYQAYVNAMFHAQYILEMAKYGWEGSNPWNQSECNNVTYAPSSVYPVWYVSPLLSNLFGRDMVGATSTNTIVRAYAARDDANNLTVFIVNNSSTLDRVVSVNISGFTGGTNGQRWLVEPAGTLVSGGETLQDYCDVNINGVIHPDPCALNWLNGVSIATSSSFDVSLPRSRMLLIKIPPANPTEQLPYGGTAWPVPGTIEAENYDTGGKFVAYYDTIAGNSAGQYRSDDVDIETCSEGGYNVTGVKTGEWLEYTVDVGSSGIYKIRARAASASGGGAFRIEFEGQDITGPVSFPATGGAQTYTNVDVNHVFLSIGRHNMRLLIDADDWNINHITFTKLGGGTGKALREWWTGISGGSVSNLTSNVNYPYNPTGRELPRSFEGPTHPSEWGLNNYGTRIRGYFHPVTTGSYTFWIASDDASELWLSTDDDPLNKTRIARVSSWVSPYWWDTAAEQESSPISLVAGQSYYIEALHKENTGGDSIAVAWEGPGIIRQAVTGPYLSPYIIAFGDFTNFANQWYRIDCNSGNAWCNGADLTRNGSVTLDDLMQFVEDWWLFGTE